MRLIDLTTTLAERSGRTNPRIEYISHERSAVERAAQIGITPDKFPRPGIHFASEIITGGPHGSATHVDAPWHYGPDSERHAARTVDELPIEWFFGDAVVLDMSREQDGGEMATADVDRALAGHRLRPGEIVLIRTDLDKSDDPEKHLRMKELSRAAAEHLLDQGVRVIGTDAASPDRSHADELAKGKVERYYPAHHLGRDREYFIVELLTNLHLLPHDGFQVALFPLKVHRASGAWCRAVAFVA